VVKRRRFPRKTWGTICNVFGVGVVEGKNAESRGEEGGWVQRGVVQRGGPGYAVLPDLYLWGRGTGGGSDKKRRAQKSWGALPRCNLHQSTDREGKERGKERTQRSKTHTIVVGRRHRDWDIRGEKRA